MDVSANKYMRCGTTENETGASTLISVSPLFKQCANPLTPSLKFMVHEIKELSKTLSESLSNPTLKPASRFIKPFRMMRQPSCKPKSWVAMMALHTLLTERPDIAARRSIDERDEKGLTALMRAAKEGEEKVVSILFEAGADMNLSIASGWTALLFAVELGHLEVVKYLIDAGAHLNINVRQSVNLIHIAAYHGHLNMVKMLCEHRDQNGRRSLSVEATTQKGETALILATRKGHQKVVEFLLGLRNEKQEYCFNLEAYTRQGQTALMQAIKEGHNQLVELLLCAHANPNTCGASGSTALMVAAFSGDVDCAQILMNACDEEGRARTCLNARNDRLMTALFIAAYNGYSSIVKLFIEARDENNCLAVNLDLPSDKDDTPFMIAAHNGHEEIVELFLLALDDHGDLRVNTRARNKGGETAVSMALKNGNEEVLEQLGYSPSGQRYTCDEETGHDQD